MKGAFRGFQKITSRVTAMGKTISTLTGLLVFLSSTAFGQVILDDFSTDKRLNYNFVPVFGTPEDGWARTAGDELQPSIGSSGAATWLWNKGQTLAAIGDSVSISVSLPAGVDPLVPTSIGLFLLGNTDGYEITSYTTLGGAWYYNIAGAAIQATAPPSGPVQLTVQRTAQTAEGFVYNVTFSGVGVPSIPDDLRTFTDPSASLQFGPFAYNTAGTSATLDNFTFTAVPEPSMYAAVFGLLALTTAVIRNRITRRS